MYRSGRGVTEEGKGGAARGLKAIAKTVTKDGWARHTIGHPGERRRLYKWFDPAHMVTQNIIKSMVFQNEQVEQAEHRGDATPPGV